MLFIDHLVREIFWVTQRLFFRSYRNKHFLTKKLIARNCSGLFQKIKKLLYFNAIRSKFELKKLFHFAWHSFYQVSRPTLANIALSTARFKW